MTSAWHTIRHNGEPREIAVETSVAAFLLQLGLNPRYVAVELNLSVVPREAHAQTLLADGDQLEIVTFVGGG